MVHNPERLKYLFKCYLHDTSTPDEAKELWLLMADLEGEDTLQEDLRLLWQEAGLSKSTDKKNLKVSLDRIYLEAANWEKKEIVTIMSRKRSWIAAAALVLLLASGTYWVIGRSKAFQTEKFAITKPDMPFATGDRAVLTLSDGTTIILDSATNGKITQQAGINLVKLANGELVYQSGGSSLVKNTGEGLYNILSIPRGGRYRLTLPDGTLVWLNSETSIKFPIQFTKDQRLVELTGEAYFEVNKDPKPFIVKAGEVDVKVLGTKFNISAYGDEQSIITTLAEGKVSVENIPKHTSSILDQGDQALYNRISRNMKVNQVDPDDYTTWKDGKLRFERERLDVIMKKLGRWYDIRVEFQDPLMAGKTFTGVALRSWDIQHLLAMINRITEVKYKIENRTLTILQNN